MSTTLRRNRRPPRDPTAATRPKNALEQAAMKSLQFRQKVQQANATSICNANSEQVGRMPMRQLLTMDRFCVPIFQRRYCWTETQWKTLLDDAAGADGHPKHSLGRLTCTNTSNASKSTSSLAGVEGRSCILDGQQRITTTTIQLAAIRDTLEKLQGDGNAFVGTIESINQLLFSDQTQMQEWTQQQHQSLLKEGAELPFARLIPTFCDRWAYYMAILPSKLNDNSDSKLPTPLPRPLQAKQFFLEALQKDYNTFPKLTKLLRGVLDGLTMLYFPVDIDKNQKDGTDDLMVIYERLALRDAAFCKPTRSQEYQSMDGSDMIRNLLLGSFVSESDALEYYKEYWLPLERARSTTTANGNMVGVLQAFLEAQKGQGNDDNDNAAVSGGVIGGQIYAEFQAWFALRLAGSVVDEKPSTSSLSVEEKVRQVGKDLLDFARALD